MSQEENNIESNSKKKSLFDEEVVDAKIIKGKASKNIVRLLIGALVMMFAGFTSAYIVAKGDGFWVNITMPSIFWVSTLIILLSSATIHLALKSAKKNDQPKVKLFLTFTLILSLAFAFSQYKGWQQLYNSGNFAVDYITSQEQYGERFSFQIDGKDLMYDQGNMMVAGEQATTSQKELILSFCAAIRENKIYPANSIYELDQFNSVTILFNGEKVIYQDRDLLLKDSPLLASDKDRLRYLSDNMINSRGAFMVNGVYGKDFTISYKNVPLELKGNRLYKPNGAPLSTGQVNSLNSSRNTASTFFYLLSFLHILHLAAGLIYLFVVLTLGFREQFNSDNHLKIKLCSIYWHFLDGLWIYLFLFLLLIH